MRVEVPADLGGREFAAAVCRAVDTVHAKGGGEVILPPGLRRTGAIRLQTGVRLVVPPETTLVADYEAIGELAGEPRTFQPFPGPCRAIIHAEGCQNFSVSGGGRIDGGAAKNLPKHPFFLIHFRDCEDIELSGIGLVDAPSWMVCLTRCTGAKLHGLHLRSHCAPHNDGIDLVGCSRVEICDVDCDVDDDAICLKTMRGMVCEDIEVRRAVLRSHCNAFKCGTDSAGDFRKIRLLDSRVEPSRSHRCFFGFPNGVSGVSLQMNDGATLEDVEIRNLEILETEAPLFFLHQNRAEPGLAPTGKFHNIYVENLKIRTRGSIGSGLHGHPAAPLEQCVFNGIDVTLRNPIYRPELLGSFNCPLSYPDGKMFGQMPASAFFSRHTKDVVWRGLKILSQRRDERPELLLEESPEAKS